MIISDHTHVADDENVRIGGNTGLPEQHFSLQKKKKE